MLFRFGRVTDPAPAQSSRGVERRHRWWLPWLALACLGGCSLSLSGPNPNRASNEVPACDTGKGLVGLDGVFGAALAVGALSAFGEDAPEAGVAVGLASVAFIAAAVRGNRLVNECRTALAEYGTERPAPAPDAGFDASRSRSRSRVAGPPPAPGDPYALGDGQPVPVSPPVAPAVVAPPPLRAAPPPAPTPRAPQGAPADDEDDWSEFWMEVP